MLKIAYVKVLNSRNDRPENDLRMYLVVSKLEDTIPVSMEYFLFDDTGVMCELPNLHDSHKQDKHNITTV